MVSHHMNQEWYSHECFTSQGLLFNSLFSYFVIVEYSKNKKERNKAENQLLVLLLWWRKFCPEQVGNILKGEFLLNH